ncbi:MAG: SAM-dependent methyltransferase [Solirubrobacteraceae bacterium]
MNADRTEDGEPTEAADSTAGSARTRLAPDWFERLYEQDDDPWRFATSEYERRKYSSTLAALGGRRFTRGLEVGCSVGVFTALLAEHCEQLVAIDVSERALALAAHRLSDRNGVSLERAAFPEQMPGGRWDLVLCSEVLYYLDSPALELAIRRLTEVLRAGGTVLAVHWRPATKSYPFTGDAVHELMLERLGRWHALDSRADRYRLDRFDGFDGFDSVDGFDGIEGVDGFNGLEGSDGADELR